MNNYLSFFNEIIIAAAASPLGILALILLIIGVIAYRFFIRSSEAVKLTVFFTLVGLSIVAFGTAFYTTEVTLPPDVNAMREETVAEVIVEKNTQAERKTMTAAKAAEPLIAGAAKKPVKVDKAAESRIAQAARKPMKVDKAAESRKPVCSNAWTDWIDIRKPAGNPCPTGCSRGDELEKKLRMVGFPPRPQVKYKFQCRP